MSSSNTAQDDAPAVDWQESADEAMACAQVEMDKQAARDAEPAPF